MTDRTQITGLKDSVELLSSLPEIPFDDEYGLVPHARRIIAIWNGI